MLTQSAELIGGDLVVTGTRPLPPEWLSSKLASVFERAEVIEFSTVAIHHQDMLLASVKAVSANYPLYGELRVSTQHHDEALAKRCDRQIRLDAGLIVEQGVEQVVG